MAIPHKATHRIVEEHFNGFYESDSIKNMMANQEREEKDKFMLKHFGGLPFEELVILVKKYHPERMI